MLFCVGVKKCEYHKIYEHPIHAIFALVLVFLIQINTILVINIYYMGNKGYFLIELNRSNNI